MTGPVTWPSIDIHTMFGPDLTPPFGIDWKYVTAFAQFALESFIGQVAKAFGGIEIAGWKPFDFLAEWGQDRIDEAQANYIATLQTQDAVSQGAEGTEITGAGTTGAKSSVDALRRGLVSNTTAIEKLAAGSGAIDEFNRTATDLGSDWLVVPVGTGTGNPATDGGNAVWRPAYPNGSLDCYCRWQGATLTTSATDYQKGTLVFNTTPGVEYLAGGGVYLGTNSILLRCDASPTIDNYVQAIVRKDGAWVVFSVVANVYHPIASGTGPPPGAASRLDFYAGELATATPRRFRLVLNDSDLLPWTTETGTSSQYGASYRGWGMHMGEQSTAFNLGTPAAIPGGINFWTANDQI